VLYTDGLVERRGEVIDEGLDRLDRRLHHALAGGGLDVDITAAGLADGNAGDDTVLLVVSLHRHARPGGPRRRRHPTQECLPFPTLRPSPREVPS
jgi:hypothetical protein